MNTKPNVARSGKSAKNRSKNNKNNSGKTKSGATQKRKSKKPHIKSKRRKSKSVHLNRPKRLQRLHREHQDIANRLDKTQNVMSFQPVISASNIKFEISQKVRAIACGGIGLVHLMVCKLALAALINSKLSLLKLHMPYHESDHVLNIAYNALCGGKNLEHLEYLRTNEVYLNALGAVRIPDPTTEGDYCRRFQKADIYDLMDAIDEARLKVWAMQPKAFLKQAWIDVDGVFTPTAGNCKQGVEYSKHKKAWGYHPLVVSLAQTQETLCIVNRPGARPSHEDAHLAIDRGIALLRRAGFEEISLRGDTDFSQTKYLDGWAKDGVKFLFGIDAMKNLVKLADALDPSFYKHLPLKERPAPKTEHRRRPHNIKEEIVKEKGWKNIRLQAEYVAKTTYQPVACKQAYTLVILRKHLLVEEKGQTKNEIRYFFYITNKEGSAAELVKFSRQRCDQENLNAHLKSDVCALRAPLKTLESNWAYMVMMALGWNLKCWLALMLPDEGKSFLEESGWAEPDATDPKKQEAVEAEAEPSSEDVLSPPSVVKRATVSEEKHLVLRMEFKTFVKYFIEIPCQIVRTGRRIVYRIVSWNPYLHIFERLFDRLERFEC